MNLRILSSELTEYLFVMVRINRIIINFNKFMTTKIKFLSRTFEIQNSLYCDLIEL